MARTQQFFLRSVPGPGFQPKSSRVSLFSGSLVMSAYVFLACEAELGAQRLTHGTLYTLCPFCAPAENGVACGALDFGSTGTCPLRARFLGLTCKPYRGHVKRDPPLRARKTACLRPARRHFAGLREPCCSSHLREGFQVSRMEPEVRLLA